VVFLVATGFLMLFSFLLVGMGLNNVENAAVTMSESLTVSVEIFGRPALSYSYN
jgi:hypothetical protein